MNDPFIFDVNCEQTLTPDSRKLMYKEFLIY